MIPRAVDVLCDEFESAIRRGNSPRIEEVLTSVSDEHRARLLYELLALELDYQLRRGTVAYLDEICFRFPGYGDTLTLLFRSFLWEGSSYAGGPTTGDLMLRHFRLKAMIGRGAFGTVWLADDTRLGREVAIKTPHAYRGQQSDGLKAALLEASAAAKLRHPHILPVYEVGDIDGRSFMVTDYAPGGTLRQLVSNQSLSCFDVARVGAQLADALQYAHAHGILHRDLKPSNILVDGRGNMLIADFGLAVSTQLAASQPPGFVCGTRAYMAPEQVEGRFGGERADIYSLGVILDELLQASAGTISPITSTQKRPRQPGLTKRLVTKSLQRIAGRCRSPDPVQRYATAESLATDLSRLAEGKRPREIALSVGDSAKWIVASSWKTLAMGVLVLGVALALALSGAEAPHPDARRILLRTDPPGCEITVVPLDRVTGDPLADRIIHAPRRSPVEMRLVPGEYLIVAVLDEEHWHEVNRRVPEPSETLGYVATPLDWHIRDGVIQWIPVDVKKPPPPQTMVSVRETVGLLVSNPKSLPNGAQRINVPAFRVAMSTTSRAQHLAQHGIQEGTPRAYKSVFSQPDMMERAERVGCRLASAAEYAAMLAQVEELSAVGVTGLDDDIPEWTSSRPGAMGTGIFQPPFEMNEEPLQVPGGMEQSYLRDRALFMGMGGVMGTNSRGESVLHPALSIRYALEHYDEVPYRFVKSLRPRTKAEDFATAKNAIVVSGHRTTPAEPPSTAPAETVLESDSDGRDM